MTLNDIVNKAWNHFHNVRNETYVVSDSIPVLWVGDMVGYFQSARRIVTLGISPSRRDFGANGVVGSDIVEALKKHEGLSADEYSRYCAHMNDYFVRGGMTGFRYVGFQRVLDLVDASYGTQGASHQVLHLNMETPVATAPSWSKLKKRERELLAPMGHELCLDMLHFLDPSLVLMSTSVNYLASSALGETECMGEYAWGAEYQLKAVPDARVLNIKFSAGHICQVSSQELKQLAEYL